MEGKKRYVAIASLAEELRQVMDDLMRTTKERIFENLEIVVNVQVPYCPNLDLLDLPGLVESKPPSGEDVPKKTFDLASRIVEEVYITKTNYFFSFLIYLCFLLLLLSLFLLFLLLILLLIKSFI